MNNDQQPVVSSASVSKRTKHPQHRAPEAPHEHQERVRQTNAWIAEHGVAAWYRVMKRHGGDGRDFFVWIGSP